MITLNNAVANELIFYLDATEDYFLFEFKSGLNCSPTYIIARNISECADYQQVIINHDFGFGGVWTVNIYEQASGSNTNPANAVLLTSEHAKIVVDTTCFNTPPVQINLCPEILPVNFSCEDLLTPYTGLDDEQIRCVLASLSCEYLRDALTYEQIECFGPPISEYTCDQLLEGLLESQISCLIQSSTCELLTDPHLGLTEEQQICVLQSLPCDLLNDPYNGLTDEQLACIIPDLSCQVLEDNLTQEQIDCLIQLQYDVDYRAILNYATVQGDTQPSDVNKLVQNDLMINLKAAATSGLSDYSLIRVWGNDINHSPIPANLGFDGYNWANVGSNQAQRVNTLTKVLKQGYHGNGVDAYVDENWNPETSGLVKTDFLWFTLYYANGIGGQAYVESLFDATFTDNLQLAYFNNNIDQSFGQIFSYIIPFAARAAQATAPIYQRLIIWRSNADLYIMINGTQYGPFNMGSDASFANGNFNSFVRYQLPSTRFEFMSDSYVKNVWGFANESTINKSLLDTALATYSTSVY